MTTITTRVSTERILRELNIAKRGMTLPLVFATLSSVALAATWAMWQEPSLVLKRLALIAFWPVIASLLVSTFTFNEAWWHYRTVKQYEPKEAPRRDVEDLLNFDNTANPTEGRLVINDASNIIPVLRYKLDQPHWDALARELRKERWEWKREALRKSKVFTVNPPGIGVSVMSGDNYNEITAEFVRCGLVQGHPNNWYLDLKSKTYFLRQARLPLEFL